MKFKKLTPVLPTKDVDACIDFWLAFGFEKTMSVPMNENQSGFASVQKDGIELMYQNYEFGERRLDHQYRSILYFEVSSFEQIRNEAARHETVVPEHLTDYGAREIYIRDPAGNMIGFAEQNATK